ncbi:hypothetical protein, partial [Vibrio breoganii]|uniref:hypothetical protein n=1 Tax=Vibrio breoganii TaxID=553239 RepID=UPI001A7E17FB
VIAYTKYFESYGFGCEQADNIDIRDHSDYDVHWYMMGTDINIPFKLRPRILIHEYQSASVGDYAILKDLIKKFWPLVRKPDIRIFLNDKLT